ncbi:alpha/beta fold hydrolase [Sciscionella sediminilitoris]|uniref:alpha/beta fold hydrolase n=1 Tax=Sciscionella sediminilitoris TaxID=1445613 RepID=UPI000AF911E2|nr:alpha/beta fold hydrolase [Sciscionella sp. SE31]
MRIHGEHAIVLGAGMGGLLAARALSEHYAAVTVVDRDTLPEEAHPRRGVPQGAHGHTLLPRGGQLIEEFFPGLLADLEERGVPVVRDDAEDIHFEPLGHHLHGAVPGPGAAIHVPSRPMLEHRVRAHLRRVPTVRIVQRCAVDGLRTTEGRVTGVRATGPDGPLDLDADLVVDALGRGARTPVWLEELGFPRPDEDTVKVRGAYSSLQMRIDSRALTEKMVLISATRTRPKGLAMFRHEDEIWDVSVFGVAGNKPPSDTVGMIDFVADFAPPHVVAALRCAEPLTEPGSRTFPASRWRRYDRMRAFPEGLLVLGDGVCSLNPTYGQGMTTAAMQAEALATTLRDGAHDLPRRYFRAAAKPVRDTWNLAAVADRAILGPAAGPLPLPIRALAPLGNTFLGAVATDPVLRDRFLRVFTLFAPPASLGTPGTGLRLARAILAAAPGSTADGAPDIPGVVRRSVTARGVRFHVTESGSGVPVLALHGWPQHHYAYRELLADPPRGLRVIAPDLPGYGWSGAAPHRWAKEDVVEDVLALLDELGLSRVLLIGHDWGGWIGHLLALRAPDRISGLLALNIAHPWQSPATLRRHLWRFAYQPVVAFAGVPLHRRTGLVRRLLVSAGVTDSAARVYADSFRDPVSARTAAQTYRSFLLREMPALARHPEKRRASVPIRALFGVNDPAIHPALAAAETARARDYTLERVPGCGHFITEERPDLVRARLLDLAEETGLSAEAA